MRRLHLATVLVLTLLSVPTQGKDKDLTWQKGTLLDNGRGSVYVGDVGHASGTATTSGNTTYGSANGSSTAVYRVYETYVIDGGDYVYTCQEHIKWRWSKPDLLTVNGPVEFAIEKDNVFLKSEDGSEHNAKLLKKVLKESSAKH